VPVLGVSLAAAMAFAFAGVFQQHAAAAEAPEHNLRLSLLWRLVRRPLWLAGIAASVVGTALQLAALSRGSLVTVQPVLVCGLLFALAINAIWLRRRLPGALEIIAAVSVCFGLVLLLVAADPQRGRGTGTPLGWAVALATLGMAVAVLVASAVASRSLRVRAGLLAVAGGLINGLSAAFIKGVARGMSPAWQRGGAAGVLARTFSNWELYAFGGTLLLGVLLVQSAFQSGPIRWSLPALTAANPVASVVLGATLLGEHIRSGPLPVLGVAVGLGMVVTGIMALSSSSLFGDAPEGAPSLKVPGMEPPGAHVPPLGLPEAAPSTAPVLAEAGAEPALALLRGDAGASEQARRTIGA
jgi:drug/metabolite transporter (DMT)-like permease